jgi:S-adenosylmethionine:tRNA ribosyltransferase-isomerase
VSALAAPIAEPAEARRPPEARGLGRGDVRLLVVSGERIAHARFADLPDLLAPPDLLVINISRTLAAALSAYRADGNEVTLNLSTPVPFGDERHWVVELRRDGGRLRDGRAGERLALPAGASAELLAPYLGTRLWVAALSLPEPLDDYLARHGRPIRYRHLDREWPLELHQNVYATESGSAEMPSAGRPFTPHLITRLVARGIDIAPLVLHTGVSSLEAGEPPYPERYRVPPSTAARANLAHSLGGRVIAVGTTVVRALETAGSGDGTVAGAEGWTSLVIGPERGVRAVDAILTGFHDSDSSHMQLLEAIAGPEALERARRAAAKGGYLRHEFGDVQLVEARGSRSSARSPTRTSEWCGPARRRIARR